MAHGTQDAMIGVSRARASRDALQSLGYGVLWREYPMAHSVCAEEIADIGAWLVSRLAPSP
jgi:phospholipase/carboxylesterase